MQKTGVLRVAIKRIAPYPMVLLKTESYKGLQERALMDYSKIARRLRDKVTRFSGELCKNFGKTSTRFVTESVYGILVSQSVVLTKMGRTLEKDVALKKIEERFCRQLAKPVLWDNIQRGLLSEAATRVNPDTLLVLDPSDIQKKYAKRMEHLAYVRDGSADVIGTGYWTIHVNATELNQQQVTPLYQSLHSQEAPDFGSQNKQILEAIHMVSKHIQKRGIWVIDRGGDRNVLYHKLLKESYRFIIRQKGDRKILYGKTLIKTQQIALTCPSLYNDTIVRMKDGRERVYHIEYGYRKVRLPENPFNDLWLLVVRGIGKRPMMILTTEPLRKNRQVLKDMFLSYIKRWSIEETIRFIKQTYDLEDIRVLRYVCLQNMMALLLLVFYFLAVVLDNNQKLKLLAGHVFTAAKRVFGIPDFGYYALGDGISAILTRNPGQINPVYLKKHRYRQLNLIFN